jgi:ribosomal protein L37AE/L43A
MKKEQYFICPVCQKHTLKRKGIKLMYTTICKDCYNKIQDSYEDLKSKGYERI